MFEKYPSKFEGRILFYDGVIESIGEMDNFLQQCAKSRENIIICSRGYSADVAYTLYQNWSQQRLFVFPFHVNDWPEEGIENFSEKLGIKCLSIESGDTLNLLSLTDLAKNHTVVINSSFLSIEDDEGDDFFLEFLFPGRYQKMMGIIEDRIRMCQRACQGISERGPRTNNISPDLCELNYSSLMVSNFSVYVGLLAAKSCENMIKNMGAAVIVE